MNKKDTIDEKLTYIKQAVHNIYSEIEEINDKVYTLADAISGRSYITYWDAANNYLFTDQTGMYLPKKGDTIELILNTDLEDNITNDSIIFKILNERKRLYAPIFFKVLSVCPSLDISKGHRNTEISVVHVNYIVHIDFAYPVRTLLTEKL